MSAIQEVLKDDIKLPSPPAIAVRILDAVRKDDSSFREIARIISSDPALAAKILKVANSSFYSLRYKVDTIEKALSVLGIDLLKNIALSFVIAEGMRGSSEGEFDFDYFWRRAITAAVAADLVSALLGHKTDDTFVTALLMDLGIVVMYYWNTTEYLRVLAARRSSGPQLEEIERDVFGFDHSEMGGELLKSWGLPEGIYQGARFHHHPGNAPVKFKQTTEILVLADALSSVYHGSRGTERIKFIKSGLINKHKIKEEAVDVLIDSVAEKTVEILSSFDLDPGDLKPYSQLLQEANEELGKLNLSYEQLVIELKQAKEKAERLAQELGEANEKLRELAFRDGLTGLFNHRYMQELLEKEMDRSVRYKRPISLIMFDIDHFKNVNDTHGHPVGDQVLKALSVKLSHLSRRSDMVARYGGEEFMVVLPETDASGANVMAQRLRRGIEQMEVATDAGPLQVTVSVGVTSYTPDHGKKTKGDLIEAADSGLYASKRGGRNQVTQVPLPR